MTDKGNKVVFVLGGSRGIGAAIVRRFAREPYRTTFTYAGSRTAAEQLALESGASAIRVDAAERESIVAGLAEHGPLDVLVVNAGVFEAGDPLAMAPDTVDRLLRINVHAPWHAAVEAARRMRPGGRIVFIGSTNADRAPMAGLAAYAASKSALQGMAKGLARDLGPRGITVNVVQPGPTDTDMSPADGPLRDTMHSFMAIKRHASVDEIASMVLWLASEDAQMVTGAALTIDGGFAA